MKLGILLLPAQEKLIVLSSSAISQTPMPISLVNHENLTVKQQMLCWCATVQFMHGGCHQKLVVLSNMHTCFSWMSDKSMQANFCNSLAHAMGQEFEAKRY